MAVTGLPTCGSKATSESVTNIAHLALDMLGQIQNLDHENESMCEVGFYLALDMLGQIQNLDRENESMC